MNVFELVELDSDIFVSENWTWRPYQRHFRSTVEVAGRVVNGV